MTRKISSLRWCVLLLVGMYIVMKMIKIMMSKLCAPMVAIAMMTMTTRTTLPIAVFVGDGADDEDARQPDVLGVDAGGGGVNGAGADGGGSSDGQTRQTPSGRGCSGRG